jgi:hypothetical protein
MYISHARRLSVFGKYKPSLSGALRSKFRVASIVGAVGLLLSSSSFAQNPSVCPLLLQAKRDLEARKAQVVMQYPGTSGMIFACAVLAGRQPPSDRTTTFLGCVGVSCMFATGIPNCLDLGKEIMGLVLQMQELDHQVDENCGKQ